MEKRANESSSDIRDAELNKAENGELIHLREQAHLLEGLRKVVPDMRIAEIICKHFDFKTARMHLVARFDLDNTQAESILNMPFEEFHGLIADDIEKQFNDLMGHIAELEK